MLSKQLEIVIKVQIKQRCGLIKIEFDFEIESIALQGFKHPAPLRFLFLFSLLQGMQLSEFQMQSKLRFTALDQRRGSVKKSACDISAKRDWKHANGSGLCDSIRNSPRMQPFSFKNLFSYTDNPLDSIWRKTSSARKYVTTSKVVRVRARLSVHRTETNRYFFSFWFGGPHTAFI